MFLGAKALHFSGCQSEKEINMDWIYRLLGNLKNQATGILRIWGNRPQDHFLLMLTIIKGVQHIPGECFWVLQFSPQQGSVVELPAATCQDHARVPALAFLLFLPHFQLNLLLLPRRSFSALQPHPVPQVDLKVNAECSKMQSQKGTQEGMWGLLFQRECMVMKLVPL